MGVYKKILGGVGLAAAMEDFLSTAALAAENGVLNYPAGAPAIFIGEFPPMPGLFMASQTSYTYADALYNSKGNKLAVPFKLAAEAETLRFLASYPAELFGAHLLSQLVVPMVHLDLKVPNFGPGPASFSDTGTGFGNITISPLIMSWNLSRTQHVALGLDIATEAATYSATKIALGWQRIHFVHADAGLPLRRPHRVRFRYCAAVIVQYQEHHNKLPDRHGADRRSQRGYNIGKWKLGVAGGYTQQLEDNSVNGVNIGNRLKQFALGPSITYTSMPYIFNLNWQPSLYAENGAAVSSIWANVALPLSVGGGPLEGPKGMK